MYTATASYIDTNSGWDQKIWMAYYDEDGNRCKNSFVIEPYLYYEDPNGKYLSLFNKPLSKKKFKNSIMRNRWIKENPSFHIYESFSPERQFLLDYYNGRQNERSFQDGPQRIHFIDIEVAVEDVFPVPSKAEYPINVITTFDNFLEKYFIYVLDEEGNHTFTNTSDREYRVFDSEAKLLNHYLLWFKDNQPDIITGWNSDGFDIPYIINRAKQFEDFDLMICKCLSPIGEVRHHSEQLRDGKYLNTYRISGVTSMDYLLLYRNKFGPGSAQSYKLEDIGQDELGYGKLEYEGTFKDFYKRDFEKFVEYNIKDVSLIVDLDKKLGFISLARTVCNLGLCEYQAVFKTSPYTIGAVTMEARSMGKRICTTNPDNINLENTGYPGGFNHDPIPKFYNKGIYSLDLNSLYPNIIIALNISMETKIGKILEKGDNEWVVKIGTTIKRLTPKQFNEKVLPKCVISANDILYRRPSSEEDLGVVPKFLSKTYALRRQVKARMIKKKAKFEKIKSTLSEEEKIAWQKDIQFLDNTQDAYKIALNSLYGSFGNKYICTFDLDNAASVTLTGQHIIQSSMKFIEENNLGTTAGGDTDSCYIDAEVLYNEMITKVPNNNWDDTFCTAFCKVIDGDIVPRVNANCQLVMEEQFNSPLGHRIEFKREILGAQAFFFKKKRYIIHVLDDENVRKDKFKYVGVKVKSNDIPTSMKNELRTIIEGYMNSPYTYAYYCEYIASLWEKFKQLPLDDISIIKGYNTPIQVTGFLQTGKGAGAHARGAEYFNQLLDKLNIGSKYSRIKVDDKVRILYLKPTNRYGINVIGYPLGEGLPPEMQEMFEIDRKKMFKNLILKPLEGFHIVLGFQEPNPSQAILVSVDDL